MSHLLDVNALLAWEHANSPHHKAFHRWAANLEDRQFWTCALTELGFIRVSMQVFAYDKAMAQAALRRIKSSTDGFIDDAPSPRLPNWVKTAGQTTEAYLVQLARTNKLKLATFDRKIRDSAVQLIV
ncbi:MAG: hypothetical protein ACKVI3_14570 [Verrucomicrobiia bacterium]